MALTVIRIPVNDMTGPLLTRQGPNDRCRDFEYRFIQCAEAYGARLMKKKCQDFYDDFQECMMKRKQLNRIWTMEKVRNHQYRTGERAEKYLPDPRHDVYNKKFHKQE